MIGKGYDSCLLGDIHERKIWQEKGTWFGYPGSLIQQNFGESERKGVAIWSPNPQFVDIPNQYVHITLRTPLDFDSLIQYKGRKVYLRTIESSENPLEILEKVKNSGVEVVSWKRKQIKIQGPEISTEIKRDKKGILGDGWKEMKLGISRLNLKAIYGLREWSGVLPEGLMILTGKNGSGKSSLVRAVDFGLFYEKKGTLGACNLHSSAGYHVEIGGTFDGKEYEVIRSVINKGGKNYRLQSTLPGFPGDLPELLRMLMFASFDYPGLEQLSRKDQLNRMKVVCDGPLFDVARATLQSSLKTEEARNESKMQDLQAKKEKLRRNIRDLEGQIVTQVQIPEILKNIPEFRKPETFDQIEVKGSLLDPGLYRGRISSVDLSGCKNRFEIIDKVGPDIFDYYLTSFWPYQKHLRDLREHDEILRRNAEIQEEIRNFRKILEELPEPDDLKVNLDTESGIVSGSLENIQGELKELQEREKEHRIWVVRTLIGEANGFLREIDESAGITVGFAESLLIFRKEGVELELCSFSKSEKVLIGLAVKYGLKKVCRISPDILFIDEVLDSLDVGSIGRVERILDLLLSVYGRIILVTHRSFVGCRNVINIF